MRLSNRFILSLLTSGAWWLGAAISLVLALLVKQMVEDKTQAEFEYQVSNAQLSIQNRVRSYIDVLRGTGALFYTADHISREQFSAYVSQLQLARSFPGITNLNFARRVETGEKRSFVSSVRADRSMNGTGYPHFAIKPDGERPEYHVLTYLEPMESNLVSFGIDIAANEPVARALDVSRDTGQLTSSGKLIRIEGPHKHVGLAMRMPVYRRGMPTGTLAERRAAYYGSVGAGFDINKLMTGAIDRKTLPFMRLKLYDAGHATDDVQHATIDQDHLLYDSEASLDDERRAMLERDAGGFFVKRVAMTVGPRVWEAEFSASKSSMLNSFDAFLPWLVLLVGLLGSVLLYSIYYSLMSARRHAVELARDMTKDLRASEASLAEAQQMAHLGSWMLDATTKKMNWSPETFHLFGLQRFSIAPQFDDFLRRLHDEDRPRIEGALERAIADGEEFSHEHRIRQRDGTVRWVKTIARPSGDGNARLVRGTIMDFTELKQAMNALRRSQELLRDLTAHQDRVKEDERRRIAREIHDELGQTLLALRIDVSMLDARTAKTHPRLNQKVREALQHIDATVRTIRTIINNLRPAVLDLGLSAAIEWQVNEFRRRSGISCDLVLEEEFAVDDPRATTLFRILQESLTNVIRHANATHVLIELCKDQEDEGMLVMKISDNGVGIYPNSRKPVNSFGLIGVEERIHALHGKFQVDSTPGKGTTLSVFIPLDATEQAAAPMPVR
jgi:PAS domain S-box-containing protein